MNIEKRRQFIINFVYYAIIAGVIYFSMKFLFNWLTPFIIGFLIAYAMNPLISWTVKKTHVKRSAVAYFYTITLAVILGLIVWLLVFSIIKYSQEYFYLLPEFVSKDVLPAFTKINTWLTDFIAGFSPEMKSQLVKLQVQLVGELQTWAINFSKNGLVLLTNITTALPFIMLTFIFTVLATVFSNVDYPNIKDFFFGIMPNKFSILVRNIRIAFKETVGKYIVAYAKIMSVTFLELSIGLTILQVPNSIFVAFLIALFDVMPVLGTGGIMVPWIAFNFLIGNVNMGVGLLILYGVIIIVRQFIEPKIVGAQLGLNPLVTLISIYVGYIWFGVAGMFIVPITANIIIRLHREGNLQHFINFEELYFDEEEIAARKKKKDLKKEQAKEEAANKKNSKEKK